MFTPEGLYEQAAQFAEDITTRLAALGGAELARVFVQPYGQVADDIVAGCPAQLAIVLDTLYRSAAFPTPDALPTPCVCDGEAVATFRARITRCVSGPSNSGTPPTPTTLSTEAAVAIIDAVALYDAACIFAARYDDALTGPVLPAGPESLAGAYEVTVTVAPDDYTPPEEP